jgi:hypothetical protein
MVDSLHETDDPLRTRPPEARNGQRAMPHLRHAFCRPNKMSDAVLSLLVDCSPDYRPEFGQSSPTECA